MRICVRSLLDDTVRKKEGTNLITRRMERVIGKNIAFLDSSAYTNHLLNVGCRDRQLVEHRDHDELSD
jgi:hypothetical protein